MTHANLHQIHQEPALDDPGAAVEALPFFTVTIASSGVIKADCRLSRVFEPDASISNAGSRKFPGCRNLFVGYHSTEVGCLRTNSRREYCERKLPSKEVVWFLTLYTSEFAAQLLRSLVLLPGGRFLFRIIPKIPARTGTDVFVLVHPAATTRTFLDLPSTSHPTTRNHPKSSSWNCSRPIYIS